ncbi:hypothetical protein ACQP3L_35115, partial [Escherichia coli]
MIFLDFGLGMLLLWEVNIEASMLLLGAILTFLTVVTILKKSKITYQKPNVMREIRRGMIFLDFGLGMLLLWEVNIEAS